MTKPQDRYPVVTYTDDRTGRQLAGGQCRCCGAGPSPDNDFYIHRASLCDDDGVFYSMLCSSCLEDMLAEQARRRPTVRDEKARLVSDLREDDLDGMEAIMQDLPDLDDLVEED